MISGRTQWFADVLRAGIDTAVLSEPDVLAHATPAVLIAEMPPDVIVGVLEAALDAGTISPKAVLQTVRPELLAEHVAHKLLWTCVAQAAERAGIAADGAIAGGADVPAREFLRRALERGLATTALTPDDIVKHVNATVITHHLPDPLKVKLLEVTLAGGKMTPQIVVETLGIDAIARHAPTKIVWACLDEAGAGPGAAQPRPVAGELASDRAVTVQAPAEVVAAAAKRLQFVDDDVDAALDVDLEEVASSLMMEAQEPPRPAAPPMSAKSRDKR